MNQLLIDNTILASSFIGAIIVSKCLKHRKTSMLFSTFLLFPPLVVFLNMWGHTVAVLVVNIQRYTAGTFHYSFTLYGHLLFGIVFLALSGLIIHYTRTYIQGNRLQKRKILLGNLVLALGFIPVIFINPIGSLPVIAALISTLILSLWDPYKTTTPNHQRTEIIKEKEEKSQPVLTASQITRTVFR